MRRHLGQKGSGEHDEAPKSPTVGPGKSPLVGPPDLAVDLTNAQGFPPAREQASSPRVELSPEEQQRVVEQSMHSALSAMAALTWGIAGNSGGFVGEVPGGPVIRFKGIWYTREGLKDQVVNHDKSCLGAKYMPERISMIDHLSAGQEFKDWQDLQNVLIQIQSSADKLDPIERDRRAREKQRQAQLAEPAANDRGGPSGAAVAPERPATSFAPTLPLSEAYEQDIGRRAARHSDSLAVSSAMAERVTAFVKRFGELRGIDLYAKIGTDNKQTAGAVGTSPEVVKAALAPDATLHEQLTHVLNFRAALANLLVDPEHKAAAVQVAREVGFNAAALEELENGASSAEHEAIYELKTAIVTRKEGAPATNTRTEEEVGIPFSDRERALWGSDRPSFGVGADQVDVNDDHPWVAEKRAQGLPVKSGPSTHTLEIFEIAKLLGLEDKLSPEQVRQAATGYLVPIGAHSLVEIEHVAAMFGCEICRGPEAYAQRLAQLGGVTLPPWKTGETLFATLKADVANPSEDSVLQAHHTLLANGYAFAGFHGTEAWICKNLLTIGFEEKYEKRLANDPWRGFYVAPDLMTATGYSADKKEPQMVRVYAPADIVARVTQARLSLDKEEAVLDELRGRLGHGLPSDDRYFIIGREAEHEADLEAVLSWAAAVQCIAIPSLHQPNQNMRGLARHSDFESGIADHTAAPSALTFEGDHAPMSTGGNQLASSGQPSDASAWQPSEKQRTHTPWDGGQEYLAGFDAKSGPTPQQVSQLRALGLEVKVGDSWQQVCAQSLPNQANAISLKEMLEPLAKAPVQSPAFNDFASQLETAKDASEITPNLYLSGHATASDLTWQAAHVRFVLNCCQFSFPHEQGIQYENLNVTSFDIGLFAWASDLLAAHEGGGTLVHCIEGKNRSATVLAAYLMKRDKLGAVAAIRHVRAKRPWAEPDVDSLEAWEAQLKNAAS